MTLPYEHDGDYVLLWAAGFYCAQKGGSVDDCPHEAGSADFNAWSDGFEDFLDSDNLKPWVRRTHES